MDARRKRDALALIINDADAATSSSQRTSLLREFMTKSEPFIEQLPDESSIWVLRGSVALELGFSKSGWIAGQQLKRLGIADRDDKVMRQLMAQLERRGWLGAEPSKSEPPNSALFQVLASPDSDEDSVQAMHWFASAAERGDIAAAKYLERERADRDVERQMRQREDLSGLWSCRYKGSLLNGSISLDVRKEDDGTYAGIETWVLNNETITTEYRFIQPKSPAELWARVVKSRDGRGGGIPLGSPWHWLRPTLDDLQKVGGDGTVLCTMLRGPAAEAAEHLAELQDKTARRAAESMARTLQGRWIGKASHSDFTIAVVPVEQAQWDSTTATLWGACVIYRGRYKEGQMKAEKDVTQLMHSDHRDTLHAPERWCGVTAAGIVGNWFSTPSDNKVLSDTAMLLSIYDQTVRFTKSK